jgi:hypothetical protein
VKAFLLRALSANEVSGGKTLPAKIFAEQKLKRVRNSVVKFISLRS